MRHFPIDDRVMYLSLIADSDQRVAAARADMESWRGRWRETGSTADYHRYVVARHDLAGEIRGRRMFESCVRDLDAGAFDSVPPDAEQEGGRP